MSTLQWTDTLALNDPRVDHTHREFVDLLGRVEAALGGPAPALQAALDAFSAHTAEHFAQEEAWMTQLGFEPQTCHHTQHQQVLEVVQEVQRRLRADGDPALVAQLVQGLAQWFPMHAQAMDGALVLTMQERGFAPGAEAQAL